MKRNLVVLLCLAVSSLTACAANSLSATAPHRRCNSGAAEAEDIRLLKGVTPLRAETVYDHPRTRISSEKDRIAGVKIVIRPPAGVSTERLTEILQCHSAHTLLGQVDASQWPDDPFWLAGTWITIEVQSEAGNYAVTLEADNDRDNLTLAAHAKAFARGRLAHGGPMSP